MIVTTNLTESTRPSPMSLREGATTLALAILGPLAIQGILISILWNLAQWGSAPDRVIEGVIFEAGSTLAIGAAIIIVLIIRYIVLAGYWLLVVERVGQPRKHAILAALPLVGIWWSVRISSRIARQQRQPVKVAPQFTVLIVGFSVLSLFLLPMSMEVATASEESEIRRLAGPCIDQFPQTTVENPVIAVGEIGLTDKEFQGRVVEVATNQLGAVARVSEEWPAEVADVEIRMWLWQLAATKNRLTASVDDMEQQIRDWEDEFGGPEALRQTTLEAGIPPSQFKRYACTNQLALALSEEYPLTETEDGSTEFSDELRNVAEREGVTVDSSIGFWNEETLSVDPEAPQIAAPKTPTAEDQQSPDDQITRTFSTRIEYGIDSIPNQEFQDTLEWQADICAGAGELLQSRFRNRVELFQRSEGRWNRIRDAEVTAQRGGRCSGGQVNLLIEWSEPEPPMNWTDKGWRTCRDYQVRIPETPTFQSATVDMCISARADTSEGQV